MLEKNGGKQAGSPVWFAPFCQNKVPSNVIVERQDDGGVKMVVSAIGARVVMSPVVALYSANSFFSRGEILLYYQSLVNLRLPLEYIHRYCVHGFAHCKGVSCCTISW